MTHACPIAGCQAKVPSERFMCARHWRMVPSPLKAAVYESYHSTGRISDNHREAIRIVQAAESCRSLPGIVPGMKALTLWQPWASLVMIGAKPYEFRRWNFTDKPHLAKLVGQRIVMHAGARPPKKCELEDILDRLDAGESALVPEIARPFIGNVLAGLHQKFPKLVMPLAAALGTIELGEPKKSFDLFRHIVADSDRLDHQMYAWPVSDIRPFDAPVSASGAQGFWNWS